jgi:hypothetical protein
MALIVEDGTGKPNADSYASVADCAHYADLHGLTFPVESPEDAQEAALRRATTWLDATYQDRFPGRRRNGRSQSLAWPRIGAIDAEGNQIADDEVPDEIARACCEAAIRELATPGSLTPDVTPGEIIRQAAVTGAVSVTYASGGVDGQVPVVTAIDNIMASLIGSRPGSTAVSMLARA